MEAVRLARSWEEAACARAGAIAGCGEPRADAGVITGRGRGDLRGRRRLRRRMAALAVLSAVALSLWRVQGATASVVEAASSEAPSTATSAAERRSAKKEVWTNSRLAKLVSNLQQEVAAVRTEVAALRRERQGDPRRSEQPSTNAEADHGPTLFLTMCGGTVYFEVYCGPFFASFERAYGEDVYRHRMVAFISNVEQGLVDAARARFGPWGRFEPFPRGDLGGIASAAAQYGGDAEVSSDAVTCDPVDGNPDNISFCTLTSEGIDNRDIKTMFDSLWFPWRIADYVKNNSDGFDYIAVMDSDMLFVRPLGAFLPHSSKRRARDIGSHRDQLDWDVAFTAYDPLFTVPWANESTAVGRTGRGLTRINCGLVLVSLQDLKVAAKFLKRWAYVSGNLLLAGYSDYKFEDGTGEFWAGWRETLFDDFRGNDQAGLALLVSGFDTEGMLPRVLGWGDACGACQRPVEANLDLFSGEEPLRVRFRALPARLLNNPESMDGGTFSADLRVVHLKGTWWRMSLPYGAHFIGATRRPEWNRDGLALHRLCFEIWQAALPQERRFLAQQRGGIFDGKGTNITEDFLNKGGG
eukprot:TRINITY_DN27411_c0_g1_i1.p1 TRINITY_DN27411_c0_g1~~TRINITY_DN27411_c0_g1_i1.p1  ORF type:complete len:601 (-),score=121.94 TRINITY_DN27411_c0_g1_i1:159-1904(-)